jgi:NAD(P)-dependent dehydrogenase (short-subunit alcohol dehydrogenase family)
LATTPVEELLSLPFLQPDKVTASLNAYQISKRANSLRVMAEAVRWGKRGARINTISPGIILTPLAKDELAGPATSTHLRLPFNLVIPTSGNSPGGSGTFLTAVCRNDSTNYWNSI